MTPQERKVLEMALEALEWFTAAEQGIEPPINKTITAIKEALAQPEQEQIQPDKVCIENDGCPTEKAVLQRFWREYQKTQPEQEPVAWVNWCAATGKRSVSFECESELASQPLYTKEQS